MQVAIFDHLRPAPRGNDIDVATDEIGSQCRELGSNIVGPTALNPNVLIFDKAACCQTFVRGAGE
jgi:hypothetical protein